MVHALEVVHGVLAPDGRLVDIHPVEDAPPIEVRIADAMYLAGWLREEDDYVEYAQADAAIAEAVRRGWYRMERQDNFTFTVHADTIETLREYLYETWEDAIVEDSVVSRAQELMRNIEADKEVILSVPVWIGRLQPLQRVPSVG